MVMDQLVTQGPVITGFNIYKDFRTFPYIKGNCLNKVYTYDGVSQLEGSHAVTIVGYGILDNKIYWLIQNSWGKNWCDNGFIKMEIGQFIEVSFTQPLISSGSKTPVEIEVTLSSQDPDCILIADNIFQSFSICPSSCIHLSIPVSIALCGLVCTFYTFSFH